MTHLDALNLRLSNERARLQSATNPRDLASRTVWVSQIEREIADELALLGMSAMDAADNMTDAELLAELGL